MKTINLLFLLLVFTMLTKAQLPALQWVKTAPGNGSSVAIDANGNVYTAGSFGSGDFDPGPGVAFLDATNGNGFILKLDAAGNFLWVKQLPTKVQHITLDALGNLLAIGFFGGTGDFDPGPGIFNLVTAGQGDIFVLKLDATGNFVWAKNMGGTQGDVGYSIATDVAGNVYTTGYYIGTVDFDPGPGISLLTAGGPFGNCFVSKLDPLGNFVWAKHLFGQYSQGYSIATDAANNLYIAGEFTSSIDFDPGAGSFPLTSAGASDIFILKLGPTGNFVWAKHLGGTLNDRMKSVTVDAGGNVYSTGRFEGTADFDPGAATFNLTAAVTDDVYISKLDASGNFVWAKNVGGNKAEAGNDIYTDVDGNVYTIGLFQGTADFDPGTGVYNLTEFGNNDIFILKLDASGNFVWAVSFGSAFQDAGNSIATDAGGNIYSTGFFGSAADFDPGPAIFTVTNGAGENFILKLGPGGVLPITLVSFSGTATDNGNELKWATSQEMNTSGFDVEWGNDGTNFHKIASLPAAGNSSQQLQYHYTHTMAVEGNNYYRLKMIERDGRFTSSAIIRINTALTSIKISASPNPVIDILDLNMVALKNETILFHLHAADGKLIEARNIQVITGSNRVKWDLHALAPGIYFISSGNSHFKIKQVIKK
ncbi:MAG: hypothetical protein ABI707_01085 [Ferruginibacter sp.]